MTDDTMQHRLTLTTLTDGFSVCRYPADTALPTAVLDTPWVFFARTDEELSLVLPTHRAQVLEPQPPTVQPGWRALKVEGPLAFELVGIMARLAGTLAAKGISLFAISTFDTDYLLVAADDFASACDAFSSNGCIVLTGDR
ncbi:MAG: ACT domain-containing protein [Pseudomonadota bacterium]